MLKKVRGFMVVVLALTVVATAFVLSACTSAQADSPAGAATGGGASSAEDGATGVEGRISVVAREDGSGTRSAFAELFKVEEEVNGQKLDATTADAVITNSTAVMLTTISGDPRAIGYISLGSLDSSVKALDIDGVAATTENVKNSKYAIQRPFNLVASGQLSPTAQDFMNFILSSDGQGVVEANHYVAVVDGAKPYAATSGASGKLVVAGSSSVTPVMEKLKEAYEAVNPDVTVEIQQSDSSTGIQATIDGICDIGMASRELKDTEVAACLTPTIIARDGIAVIVNKDFAIDGLTSAQVKDIYLGTIGRWEEVAG
jgi:phosphate transport system substrate-binding protein